MKRMLINATQQEELRMAMVDGQRLYDLNIELPASERTKANIYKGKITRIEPSLEAAFVDYGADRHGFLPLKEISSEYFVTNVDSGSKTAIKDVLKEGQDIVVQIDKEERGTKGAALTTFVSLAGRFIVLKPNKSRSGGVSRRIVGADRDLARDSLNEIEIPKGMSVILRTAGIDRGAEELAWDLENLLTVWKAILNVVLQKPSPFLIYRESNSVVRALRDYLSNEIGEILIDDEVTYKEAAEFVEQVMPHNLRKLKHYSDPVPLFTRYQIESQIESAFSHSVTLPSGGSIVIDHTEALVSIDINSARATKGSDIEATALNTNSEAAEEIARQLRLRDLGGLIVIDFIDMGPQKNQREVENRLRESVRQDRARVQLGKISRFGLLEMSRQRLRPSLGESSYHTCPRCSGLGTIRSIESLALTILRIIGEEVRKERTAKVIAQLPAEVATYLLNEKRDWVQGLESRNDTQVILVANSSLETPHYQIRRVRDDQIEFPENAGASYELADTEAEPEVPPTMQDRMVAEPAAIATMKPATPAPKRKPASGKGMWATILGWFSAGDEKPKSKKSVSGQRRKPSGKDSRSRGAQRGRQRSDSKQQSDSRDTKRKRTRKPASKKSASTANRGQSKDETQKTGQAQKATTVKQDDAGGDAKKPSRPRRSRSGRRRKRSGEKPEQETAVEQDQGSASSGNEALDDKPASAKPDASPGVNTPNEKPKAAATAAAPRPSEGGPPKVRTDAERAADAISTRQTDRIAEAPRQAPVARTDTAEPAQAPRSKTEAPKPPVSAEEVPAGNGASAAAPPATKPQGRLLPWEPVAAPAAAKPIAPAKPVEAPIAKAVVQEATPKPVETPVGRQTQSTADAPLPDKPVKPVSDAADNVSGD